jgi:putative aldouronate transport system permease protein
MAQISIEKSTEPNRKPASRGAFARFMKQLDIQMMVWPGILLILVFSYIPMYGVLMAFQDYSIFNGFFASPWVGLKHFRMFFESPELCGTPSSSRS